MDNTEHKSCNHQTEGEYHSANAPAVEGTGNYNKELSILQLNTEWMEENSRCSILPLNIFMPHIFNGFLIFLFFFLAKPINSYTSMKTPREIILGVVIQKMFHTAK